VVHTLLGKPLPTDLGVTPQLVLLHSWCYSTTVGVTPPQLVMLIGGLTLPRGRLGTDPVPQVIARCTAHAIYGYIAMAEWLRGGV
jgi:hypothetical protein